MADLNEVRLIGRLTRDPELRSTPSGQAVCSFGLATSRKFRGQDGALREDTAFVDITCWSKLAENTARYLKKGRLVYVGGRLRFESWQDRQSGQKRSRLTVVAENVQFLEWGDSQPGQNQPTSASSQWSNQTPPQSAPQSDSPSQWSPPPVDNSPSWDEPDVGEPPF